MTLVADCMQVRGGGVGKFWMVADPVRPLRAVTVIIEVPDAPANIWLGLTAPAEMLKSTTWKTIAPEG